MHQTSTAQGATKPEHHPSVLGSLALIIALAALPGSLAVGALLVAFERATDHVPALARFSSTSNTPPSTPAPDALSSGPQEFTAVLTVGAAANVAVEYATTWEHSVARCTNTTAGVNLFIVNPGATDTTAGAGPYCDTCAGGAILPPLGRAWLRTSAGSATVRCSFNDGWGTSSFPPSSAGGGVSLGTADGRYLMLDASNDPLTGQLAGQTTLSCAAGAPGYSWAADTDSGFAANGTGTTRWCANANTVADGTSSGMEYHVPVHATDGTPTEPGLSFRNATGSGFYHLGAGQMRLMSNGVLVDEITSAFHGFTQEVRIKDGTLASLGIAYANDADTGLFSVADDAQSVTAGGSERMRWTTGDAYSFGCVTVDSAAGVDARLCEGDLDLNNAAATTFNVRNSGAGAATLQVDGVTVCTTAGGAGCTTSPGGSDTFVQYNNGGAFGGNLGFVYDDTNQRVGIVAPTLTRTPATTLNLFGTTTYPAILRIQQESTGASGPYAQIDLRDSEADSFNAYVRGATVTGTFNGLLTKANAVSLEAASVVDKYVITNTSTGGRIFLGANGTSTTFMVIDGSSNVVIGTNGETAGGAVTATAQLELRGVTGTPALIVNETGTTSDTRIEGDTQANLVFVNATTDRVGIGTGAPATLLDVEGTCTVNTLLAEAGTAAAPSIALDGTDEGLYQTGLSTLGIATNGLQTQTITGGFYTWYRADGTTQMMVLDETGTDYLSVDANVIASATDLRTLGTALVEWDGLFVDDGALGSPSVAVGDDSGLYRVGADSLGVDCGGVNCVRFTEASIGEGYIQLGTAAGSAAMPSIHRVGDTDTGLGWYGADNMGMSVGAVQLVGLTTSGVQLSGPKLDVALTDDTTLPGTDCDADAEVGDVYRYSKAAGATITHCTCTKVANVYAFAALGAGDCT